MKIIGKIYSITNSLQNEVEIIDQLEDGTLKPFKKVHTHGRGSENYSVFHHIHRADPQLSAYGIILSSDNKYLFAINGKDNSVSSFKVSSAGDLAFINNLQVPNTSAGTISSLALNEKANKLYVNCFWGNHLTIFTVKDGFLSSTNIQITFDTLKFPKRSCPSITLSPDNKYLFANIHTETNDAQENLPAIKDNYLMIKLTDDGSFSSITHYTIPAGPFSTKFITDDLLIISAGSASSIILGQYQNKTLTFLSTVKIDPFLGIKSAETCWQTYDPLTKTIYATNFSYGTIASAKLKDNKLFKLNDQEDYVPGIGLDFLKSGQTYSGALDILNLNSFIYAIYNSNGIIRGYDINSDGSLFKLTDYPTIAQNQFGLAGFSFKNQT